MKSCAIAHCPTTASSSSRQNQMPRRKPSPRCTIVIANMTSMPMASESATKLAFEGVEVAVTAQR